MAKTKTELPSALSALIETYKQGNCIAMLEHLTPELARTQEPHVKKNIIGWAVCAYNKMIADGERDERQELTAFETLNAICIMPSKWHYFFDAEEILKYAIMLDMQITMKISDRLGEPRPILIISPYKH